MEAFEVNKTIGAVLTALLVVFASKTMLDIAYKEHKPEKPGWALPITEVVAKSKEPAAPFDASKVVALLAKANPDSGQDTFKKCLSCHTPQKGGPNGQGPNLWGVVGRKPGSHAGFPYSEAMKSGPGMRWRPICTTPRPPSPATRWHSPASGMTPSWLTFWPICASSRTRRLPCRSRPPPVDQPAS